MNFRELNLIPKSSSLSNVANDEKRNNDSLLPQRFSSKSVRFFAVQKLLLILYISSFTNLYIGASLTKYLLPGIEASVQIRQCTSLRQRVMSSNGKKQKESKMVQWIDVQLETLSILPIWINLPKNLGDTGGSSVVLSLRGSFAYLCSAISQQTEEPRTNQ